MSAEPDTVAIDPVGHIVRTEGVMSGRPRIAGTRIRVMDIVSWHLVHEHSVAEMLGMFPGITEADIYAALTYYYDHRDEVDAAFRDDAAFAQRFLEENPDIAFVLPE